MEMSWEYRTLISELTQGMELTKQLKVHLNSVETRELLLERILSSFERSLMVLKWSGSSREQLQPVSPATGVPDSCISGNASPRSEDTEKGYKGTLDQKDVSKKRKLMPTWTDQVRVYSESGLEGPINDGYSWRKYGQKDILGAKHPRSYYRCTYRNMQNCWATKQVQRSDDDPTILEITYKGQHVCNVHASNGAPAPSSPEKEEPKQTNNQNTHQMYQKPNEMLLNFQTNLRVNIEDLENKEISSPFTFPSASFEFMKSENQNFPFSTLIGDNMLGGLSPNFASPASFESNCFQMNNIEGVHNLRYSESEHIDIVSTNTSSTNSPVIGPNYPFHNLGFFN